MTKDIFAGTTPTASNQQWFKFGKVGDYIRGTFLTQSEQPGQYGMQQVYTIEVDDASFHNITDKTNVDKEPTILKKGTLINVSGRAMIDRVMKTAIPGQLVAMAYTKDFKAKLGAAKTIEVRLGPAPTK
jgi:hypothetical protein